MLQQSKEKGIPIQFQIKIRIYTGYVWSQVSAVWLLGLLIIHATDAEIAWIHTRFNSLGTTSCKYC